MDSFKEVLKHTSKLKLLYIEKSEEIIDSTLEIIKDLFKQVIVANSSEDAIDIYNDYFSQTGNHFDIVLTNCQVSPRCTISKAIS